MRPPTPDPRESAVPQLKVIFGRQLRDARRARGITQSALAERIDRSLEMVGRLERGEIAPSFETIERIVKELEVPPVFLFGGESGFRTDSSKILREAVDVIYQLDERDLERAIRLLRAL